VCSALQASDEDWQLLRQMQEIAQAARYEPDSRVRRVKRHPLLVLWRHENWST
jgi:hypothetical protein